ncbi:MAG: DEAD/DEAH box helicase [Magnetococcales bacterium]|nr:DEAD/DEAH box helicase [Magnetococcales bacterium]
MKLQLRPYQRAAVDSIYRYFDNHSGHPLIVLPTAGGKSLVLSTFIQEAIQFYPDTRILVVTHVRELISQNFAELMNLWPEAPAGIYSAGLNRRDTEEQILFCGIQSVHRKAYDIQRADLVLVDESHLIPRKSDTMYRRFLEDLKRINPYLKIIGLTATPYRLDSGLLHQGEDALFSDIAFEVPVRDLVEQGYLAPLISKATAVQLDVTGVGSRGGEFIPNQLEAAVDQDPVTRAAVEEIVAFGQDRRSWLLFCSGVAHATHVRDAVRRHGISCECLFGDTAKEERDRLVTAFKRGDLRALSAMNVLTTGFNAPAVDLIAMLRPTKSTGLYVQIAGRGMRLAPSKSDCLVLDFAGNVKRHGPIDQVNPKQHDAGEGEAPVKDCPVCHTINHAAVRICLTCGYEFPPPEPSQESQLEATASTMAIMTTRLPVWVKVDSVAYHQHEKPGRPLSMRVEYQCGLVRHQEWVCFEHDGFARRKAESWWQRRAAVPVPTTVQQAMDHTNLLRVPTSIAVRSAGRWTEVVQARFTDSSHV